MSANQNQDSILRRLRALIARAEHPNTPEPEAKLSREQAEKLMIKYSITSALLGDAEENKTKPGDFRFDIFGSYQKQRTALMNVIAKAFNCELVTIHHGRYAETPKDFHIFGFEADLDMAWTLFLSLDSQLLMQLGQIGGNVSYKKSFAYGFIQEVGDRLEAFYTAEVESAQPGTELVLANRKDEVVAHRLDTIGKVQKARSTQLRDWSGYGEGMDAGAKADIGLNGNKIGTQGAIAG